MVPFKLPLRARVLLPVVGVLVALGTVGAGAWYWMTETRYIERTDNAYVKADAAMIAPDIRGRVVEVAVEENQRVEAGDPLIRIERDTYQARVAEARGEVAALRAKRDTLERRIATQKAVIERARTRVARAEAERWRAAKARDRYRDLADDRAGSREQFENARAAHRKAVAAVQSAQARVEADTRRLAMLRAKRAETDARLKQAKATVRKARIALDDTVVRAPAAGIVGDKSVERGQYVRPGQEVFTLVPVRDVYVEANFKESQLANLAEGQPVQLTVDAFPETPLNGQIQSFAPATGAEFALLPPKNATGNFTEVSQRVPVRIAVPSDTALKGALRPGLSVEVAVDTDAGGNRPTDGAGLAKAALPGAKFEPRGTQTADGGAE